MRKDRIEDKDEESWNNVGNMQDFRLLDSSYTGKTNKKVKPKDYTIQQRNVLNWERKHFRWGGIWKFSSHKRKIEELFHQTKFVTIGDEWVKHKAT